MCNISKVIWSRQAALREFVGSTRPSRGRAVAAPPRPPDGIFGGDGEGARRGGGGRASRGQSVYVVCARSRMPMRSLSASMQQAHRNMEMAVAVNTPL